MTGAHTWKRFDGGPDNWKTPRGHWHSFIGENPKTSALR